MKRTVFCITILICLSDSFAFGIAPIGQPSSNLRKGWWSVGADYSTSEIDLDIKETTTNSFISNSSFKDENIDLFLGKVSYGVKNYWEVFAGLGVAKAEGFSSVTTSQWGDSAFTRTDVLTIDAEKGYAAQIGTKLTLYERKLIKAGVTCQFTYLGMSNTLNNLTYKDIQLDTTNKVDIDSDLMILQIAPGLSYEFLFGFSIYGGPVYQWINGTVETSMKSGPFKGKEDIKESSFGGFVGLHADVDIFTSLNVEYQMTGNSNTIGLNLMTKF